MNPLQETHTFKIIFFVGTNQSNAWGEPNDRCKNSKNGVHELKNGIKLDLPQKAEKEVFLTKIPFNEK